MDRVEFSVTGSELMSRVWTRWEHGSEPVFVWRTERSKTVYELKRKSGSELYRSARRLLVAITGRNHNQTFRRYFKLDDAKVFERRPNIVAVLDAQRRKVRIPAVTYPLRQTKPVLAPVETPVLRSELQTQTTELEFRESSDGLKLTDGANEALVRGLVESFGGGIGETSGDIGETRGVVFEPGMIFGIDLVNRSHEVRKLLFKSFRGHMGVKGYDPDDVLQEIYKGLITRNAGTCPWDGRKSTFGYYVTMVIRCVLTNYHRKMSRRLDREHLELDDTYEQPGHVETSDEMARGSLEAWLGSTERGGDTPDGRLSLEILPMVAEGRTRREIVEQTGERDALVSRALSHLRKWSRLWAAELGVSVNERKRRRRKSGSSLVFEASLAN